MFVFSIKSPFITYVVHKAKLTKTPAYFLVMASRYQRDQIFDNNLQSQFCKFLSAFPCLV